MQYQISFYVPQKALEKVKNAMFLAGAGRLGDYQNCAWQVKGVGQFRPIANAKPSIGKVGNLEQLTEYKVEIFCEQEYLKASISALKKSHPYEEVAYSVVKILNE